MLKIQFKTKKNALDFMDEDAWYTEQRSENQFTEYSYSEKGEPLVAKRILKYETEE